ncbi:MAG: exodeoxyribonuclease V subunit gamma [Desulfobulbaceae bacterium]|nr:exodeoxyribonuclease V subunit gamma [Desulfobulbaceae bacterium]
MLYFIQSNRLEKLFDRLCEVLADSQDDPLQPREIVVQNPGMARWVSQQTALRQGIAANLHFPLPARFIWRIFASQLPLQNDEGDFHRSVLLWRIFEQLSGPLPEGMFAEIEAYLGDDHDGRKTFHLAGRIADLFDQYLVYRPDMLLDWEANPAAEWQAVLWNRLPAPPSGHRAGHLRQFRQKVLQGGLDPLSLPRQLYIFGVSSLAPVYLEVIHSVSRVTDLYLFHLSPCREYWADLSSDRELARKRAGSPRKNVQPGEEYYFTGNPLLASQGKVGREFISQIYNLEMIEEEHYHEPAGRSMLVALQRDILDLVDHSGPAAEKIAAEDGDRSVQLHSCHSRMREIQVLHDRLLEMFEHDPDLKPGDILVMAPSMEEYAPAVRSVFDGAEGNRFIPWALADRSFRSQEPLVDSFLSLFELCSGRCGAPDVVSFLENPAVLRRFRIDEHGLETIRDWIRDSGIRWGLDRQHRREFVGGVDEAHSWSFGMNRLLMGYFTGRESNLVHGIAPCGDLLTGRGQLLGRLAAFLDRLRRTREHLSAEKPPGQWVQLLLELLDQFYDPAGDEADQQALLTLRETICGLDDDCRKAGFAGAVNPAVIKAWLEEALAGPSSGQAFLSGRATFCNMVPMRSVPFAVICLLGMNDTDYPRNQSRVGFDLMARNPLPGDRNRRDDDRYLFIEALVSARRVLYISWLGRHQRDNSIRPPSVVVSELLDYLGRSFVSSSGKPLAPPVVDHPLQPFSSRCFDGTPATLSYAAQWLPAGGAGEQARFVSEPLAEPSAEWRTVDVDRFVRFWSNPVRFFLEQRLEMKVQDDEDLLEENEPFLPGHLDRYAASVRLIDDRLQERRATDKVYAQLWAEGVLPHGGFGSNFFQELSAAAESFVPDIATFVQDPRDPLEVDIAVDSFRLTGWLGGLYEGGCIRYRPAKLKGRDLVKLWLEHLIYNVLAGPGSRRRSVYVASDQAVTFRPVDQPRLELKILLDLYWQGLSTPLHFYPETSRAWFEGGEGSRESAAQKVWQSGFNIRGEGEALEYCIALQGAAPLDEDFQRLAAAVYGPLNEHLEHGIADV